MNELQPTFVPRARSKTAEGLLASLREHDPFTLWSCFRNENINSSVPDMYRRTTAVGAGPEDLPHDGAYVVVPISEWSQCFDRKEVRSILEYWRRQGTLLADDEGIASMLAEARPMEID
jgi:hypothetical protein